MFADNLKKYRIAKGFSQADVAEKLFVTRQCVSKWEKGITEPDLQTLNNLSELLEVSVDTLLNANKEISNNALPNYNLVFFTINILTAVFCLIAFLVIWRFLPQNIPAHWSSGAIDRYGSHNEIFLNYITTVVFLIVDVIMYFAFKRSNDKKVVFISHGVIVIFQIVNLVFILALYAKYLNSIISFITCISVDLIMCVLITMHPKISKQNYLLGIRTTETLQSPTVWNKTNALGCYLFAGISLIVLIVNMIFSIHLSFLCLLAYIAPTIITIVYSRIIYKNEQDNSGNKQPFQQ